MKIFIIISLIINLGYLKLIGNTTVNLDDTVNVKVFDHPYFDLRDQEICEGNNDTFLTLPKDFVQYNWSTGANFKPITYHPSEESEYTLTLIDSFGNQATVTSQLIVTKNGETFPDEIIPYTSNSKKTFNELLDKKNMQYSALVLAMFILLFFTIKNARAHHKNLKIKN